MHSLSLDWFQQLTRHSSRRVRCDSRLIIYGPLFHYSLACVILYKYLHFFRGVGGDRVHLARRALVGPLYQPRMMVVVVSVEQ
jgi:hypothetical protein